MIELNEEDEALVYVTLLRIAHGITSNTSQCDMNLADKEGINIILMMEKYGPEIYEWPDKGGRELTKAAHEWMRNYEAKALNQKV